MISNLNLASKVNSAVVQSYLKNMGWTKINSKREHVGIFTKGEGGDFMEIQLPLNRTFFSDYNRVISQAIDTIAKVEDKDPAQIMSDLILATPSDVIRIRVPGDGTEDGTISFDEGFRLIENAKDALYTAACDILQPEIYHKRLGLKQANNFISQCRLGQTERGSFITSIICPFVKESETDDALQYSLFDDKSEYGNSLTRHVTTRVMQSIQLLNKSIEAGELDRIVSGEADIKISANFLESIVAITKTNEKSESVEFISSWSSLLPPVPSTPSKIEIQKDFINAIDTIIDRMIPQNVAEYGEFVGKIYQLKADADLSKREDCEITMTLISGDKMFNAKTVLDSARYAIATEAHIKGKNIFIRGELISGRKSKFIKNTEFRIIE